VRFAAITNSSPIIVYVRPTLDCQYG